MFLSAGVSVVLARLMPPAEFGKIAMIMSVIGLGDTLAQFGMAHAIIQQQDTTDEELTSVFWFAVALGLAMTGLTWIAAPPIEQFYDVEGLASLIRLGALSLFLGKASLVFRALFQRELAFERLAPLEIVQLVLSSAVAVTLAYLGYGARSRIVAEVLGAAVLLGGLAFTASTHGWWQPTLHFSLSEIRPFLGFGAFVTGKSMLNYAAVQLDVVIIGKLLGVNALGLYHFAKGLMERPRTLLSQVFSKVNYPLYSRILSQEHGELSQFHNAYGKLSNFIATIGLTGAGYVLVAAPAGIPLLFGEQWRGGIVVAQVFALAGVFELLSAGFASSALYAFGRANQVFWVDVVTTPIRIAAMTLAALSSVSTVASAQSASIAVKSVVLQHLVNRESGLTWRTYLGHIKAPLLAFVVALTVAGTAEALLRNLTSDLSRVLIVSGAYGVSVMLCLLLWQRGLITEVWNEGKTILQPVRAGRGVED